MVKREDYLIKAEEKQPKTSIFSPFLMFSLLTIIGIYITAKDHKKKKRTKWLDFILTFTTGIIGCVILFLWFFSTHATAPNNFNLLWAFAPNLIISFLLLRKKTPKVELQKYFFVLMIFMLLIPVIWITKIQAFPLAVTPLLILLFVRYYFLSKRLLSFKK